MAFLWTIQKVITLVVQFQPQGEMKLKCAGWMSKEKWCCIPVGDLYIDEDEYLNNMILSKLTDNVMNNEYELYYLIDMTMNNIL